MSQGLPLQFVCACGVLSNGRREWTVLSCANAEHARHTAIATPKHCFFIYILSSGQIWYRSPSKGGCYCQWNPSPSQDERNCTALLFSRFGIQSAPFRKKPAPQGAGFYLDQRRNYWPGQTPMSFWKANHLFAEVLAGAPK